MIRWENRFFVTNQTLRPTEKKRASCSTGPQFRREDLVLDAFFISCWRGEACRKLLFWRIDDSEQSGGENRVIFSCRTRREEQLIGVTVDGCPPAKFQRPQSRDRETIAVLQPQPGFELTRRRVERHNLPAAQITHQQRTA